MRIYAINKAHVGVMEAKAEPVRLTAKDIFYSGGLWSYFYDAFREVFPQALALAEPGDTLVVELDTPGGEVTGLYSCCYDVSQARASRPDVDVIVFTDGMLCSAGYDIACSITTGANDEIVCTPTAELGSIGAITAWVKPNLAAQGIDEMVWFSWPPGKADGRTGQDLSTEGRDQIQDDINKIGELFVPITTAARGLTLEQIVALDAQVFLGQRAIDAGLADRLVQSRADLMSGLIVEDESMTPQNPPAEPAPTTEPSSDVAALREEVRALRVGSLLAARADLTDGMRQLLASKSHAEVEAFLAAMPAAKKVITAVPELASAPADPDAGLERSEMATLNAYLPHKPIAARRAVEKDDVHNIVRIR